MLFLCKFKACHHSESPNDARRDAPSCLDRGVCRVFSPLLNLADIKINFSADTPKLRSSSVFE